jgi:hypothetical protein
MEVDRRAMGPAGLQVEVSCGHLRCGVIWCPLKPSCAVYSWIIPIKFDNLIHLDGFLDKPCGKQKFTKTHEIVNLHP